ncbi:MAG: hypothetical protein L0Y58_03240 [Verrucomicrobia subdivision 3 bacterium]|nr:hypothetical protein [Limisphaerales bacterium]
MTRIRAIFLAAATGAAGFSARAETTNAPPRAEIQSFRIVMDRNIFNPNRSNRPDRETRTREPERQTKIESFSLVGTMNYEKGWFAFFDGTGSEYKKVLKPEDSIAGYKIADIGHDSVTLQSSNNEVQLRVGMQMKRRDEGEWQSEESAGTYETVSASTNNESKAESAADGEQNEVLRRLMQQREKELEK